MHQMNITVIGTGALGRALTKALHAKGVTVYSLFNRSSKSLRTLATEVNAKVTGSFPQNYSTLGDIIFITTPDQVITHVAEKLALLGENFLGKTIVHCSGTKTSDCLSALQQKGASAASFHPIQTFTGKTDKEAFKDIYFDIEGDDTAKVNLKQIAKLIDSQVVNVSKEAKPYLHAAGVMSSNYLLALLTASAEIAELGGIEYTKACRMILPLARQTIENMAESAKTSDALSGPVVRGDTATVQAHLDLLKQNENLLDLYKRLGNETLKLAIQKGTLSPKQQMKLIKLFGLEDGEQ